MSLQKVGKTLVKWQQVGLYFGWQVRSLLSVFVCVYTVVLFNRSSSTHLNMKVGLEDLDSPVPHQGLNLTLIESCSKVFLDVMQSPAIRSQFKRKTAHPKPLTREKRPYLM